MVESYSFVPVESKMCSFSVTCLFAVTFLHLFDCFQLLIFRLYSSFLSSFFLCLTSISIPPRATITN